MGRGFNKHPMRHAMVSVRCEQLQIGEGVIGPVSILVMDNLIAFQWATNRLLHNVAMLINAPAFDSQEDIAHA